MTLCTTTKFFEGTGNFSTEIITVPVPEKEPFWKRILIIDDETDITIALKKALTDNGFEQVETFNDPLLALKSFKVDLYDLLILDIIMPEIDGFELYEQMRSIDRPWEFLGACPTHTFSPTLFDVFVDWPGQDERLGMDPNFDLDQLNGG